jgi:hypothetical protein
LSVKDKKAMPIDCAILSGDRFRPLFGQPLSPEQFEEWLGRLLPGLAITHRAEEGVTVLDWQDGGISYSAGFQYGALLFVSQRFGPGKLSVGQVIACLGAPQGCQAWYDSYPEYNASSLHAALIYLDRQLAVFGSNYLPIALPQPPELNEDLAVNLLNLFGPDWAASERRSGQSRPWPGSWKDVEIKLIRH